MTIVYYTKISDSLSIEKFRYYLSTLPVYMQLKIENYRNFKDQKLILFGKLLLRTIGNEFNTKGDILNKIKYNSFGRPYVIDEHINDFNISHSGDYVVCVVSNHCRVGIDIEKIDKNINILDYKSQMLDQEWFEIMNSSLKSNAFYDFWTKKEAVVKAEGEGLSIPFKSFQIVDNIVKLKNKLWHLKLIKIDLSIQCNIATDYDHSSTEILLRKIKNNEF